MTNAKKEIALKVKERAKEQVKALLRAENINIADVESAEASLRGCVLPKKCLEAYRSILEEHNSF